MGTPTDSLPQTLPRQGEQRQQQERRRQPHTATPAPTRARARARSGADLSRAGCGPWRASGGTRGGEAPAARPWQTDQSPATPA
eukprot:900041-Rhodomonas_salina.1